MIHLPAPWNSLKLLSNEKKGPPVVHRPKTNGWNLQIPPVEKEKTSTQTTIFFGFYVRFLGCKLFKGDLLGISKSYTVTVIEK